MKKILYSVILAVCGALMFTGCSNDDETGVENVRNYESSFEKKFGAVNPSQNFNTQKGVTIDASFEEANGNYTLKVYDGMPGKKGTSLLGQFENLIAGSVSTVKVGVSKGVKDLYFMADDGKTRFLTASEVPTSGHVKATFDAYSGGAPVLKTADEPTSVTIAFEDLGVDDDFDFNDVVIKVDYVTGTGTATVTLMAVASTLPEKLYFAPAGAAKTTLFDGKELHSVMGYGSNTVINGNWKSTMSVKGVDYVPFQTCEISVPEDFVIDEDGVPFILEVDGKEGQIQITSSTAFGATPQVLVVGKYFYSGYYNGSYTTTAYNYRWPKDKVRINLAFPNIGNWMNNPNDVSFLRYGKETNLYNGYDPTTGEGFTVGEAPAGLEAVDLGLPSGTKWANMNVGATAPEEYGGYYAWGEIAEKSEYTSANYRFFHGSYVQGWWSGISHPLYDFLGVDIAGTEYDVATVNWGSEWQMPSGEQIRELVQNTWNTPTTQNGVSGMLFSNNGNSIFLPAASYRNKEQWSVYGNIEYHDHYENNQGKEGNYWASTRVYYSYGGNLAYWLPFTQSINIVLPTTDAEYNPSISDNKRGGYRYYGCTVRPVLKE